MKDKGNNPQLEVMIRGMIQEEADMWYEAERIIMEYIAAMKAYGIVIPTDNDTLH